MCEEIQIYISMNVNLACFSEAKGHFTKKLEIEFSFDLALPFPGIYSMAPKHKGICISDITGQFAIVRIWKQLMYS